MERGDATGEGERTKAVLRRSRLVLLVDGAEGFDPRGRGVVLHVPDQDQRASGGKGAGDLLLCDPRVGRLSDQ